jgi:flagellin-specific chaperone FliS
MNFFEKILIGIYHAKYHRNLKKAERSKENKNIHNFKKYIYRAEDAWKQIVIIKKKYQNE